MSIKKCVIVALFTSLIFVIFLTFMKPGMKAPEVFTLVVDYGRSVKDGVVAGKYDYADSKISDYCFPPTEYERGAKGQFFMIYHFGIRVDYQYVIAEMEKDGNRPATLRELLALGEAKPDLQRQFTINALGSEFVSYPGHAMAYLWGYGSKRYLHLRYYKDSYTSNQYFLAVSK